MNFLIIGAGLIGQERIKALLKLGYKDIYIHDTDVPKDLDKNVKVANKYTFKSKAPDWVFIATPHSCIEPWVRIVAEWGSKILIEKPFGRNYQEAKEIYSHLKYPEQLFVGFNYRFYPGINKLCEDIIFNKFGKIISINMVLGHGGKPEDANSWKLNTFDGSSDCLLDPAIHFLDIINMMFPYAAKPLFGKYWQGFWNTGVKEEIHIFYDVNDFIINLQTSLVRWKSTFRIEVNGVKGYGIVTGTGIRVFHDGKIEALGDAIHQYMRHGERIDRSSDILPTT